MCGQEAWIGEHVLWRWSANRTPGGSIYLSRACALIGQAVPCLLVLDRVGNATDAVNLDLDNVTIFEPQRWLSEATDTWWGAGEDQVARLERNECRDPLDHLWDGEDELLSGRVLHSLAVKSAPDALLVDVANFVLRDNGRADWCKRVEGFAHQPLATVSFQLPITGRDIVGNSVSSDKVQSVFQGGTSTSLADDNAQFHFKVELLALFWQHDWAARSSDARGKFGEDNWLCWYWHVLLCTMVNVVHADAHNLLGVVDDGIKRNVGPGNLWSCCDGSGGLGNAICHFEERFHVGWDGWIRYRNV